MSNQPVNSHLLFCFFRCATKSEVAVRLEDIATKMLNFKMVTESAWKSFQKQRHQLKWTDVKSSFSPKKWGTWAENFSRNDASTQKTSRRRIFEEKSFVILAGKSFQCRRRKNEKCLEKISDCRWFSDNFYLPSLLHYQSTTHCSAD